MLVFHVIQRQLTMTWREKHQALNPLLFFLMITSLFPLLIPVESRQLPLLAPGVIWISALLASLLSLETLFSRDYADGTLEMLLTSEYPLSWIVFAKVLAHWCISALPLLLVTPVMTLFYGLSVQTLAVLLLGLMMGTLVLSFLGAIAVALTLGLPQASILLSLIIIPLYIPVFIFGVGMVIHAEQGMAIGGEIAWLLALLLSIGCLTPVTAAAALNLLKL